MDFSLIFFSGDEHNKYRLVLDAARFADAHRFEAIWIPERHFHRFGGLYPNPSVLGAALAMVTKRLKIRAGSVVLPLHDPVRVAEEWSVVDNLSGGGVALKKKTGFSPIDFVFRPENWSKRRDVTFGAVEILRSLWEGSSLFLRDGAGNNVEIELHPSPLQERLPLWLTCTKSTETFVKAGELGCGVLTGLVDMGVEELGRKIAIYRRTLEVNGHEPTEHRVSLMMHAFVGDDINRVKEIVREPFLAYLKSFLTVIDSQKQSLTPGQGVRDMAPGDREALLEFGFDKFFGNAALMGTVESCSRVVERIRSAGVDEIACLIDFGVDDELVMESLDRLDVLRRRYAEEG